MYMYIHIYAYIHMCTHVPINLYRQTLHMCPCMHAYVHADEHMYVYAYLYVKHGLEL